MKHLFALPLALISLTACSPSPNLSPEQIAVTNHIKKKLDDPESYQSARWSAAEEITVGGVNKIESTIARLRYSIDSAKVSHDSVSHLNTLQFEKHITYKGSEIIKRKMEHLYDSLQKIQMQRRDSTRNALNSVGSLADKSPAGHLITHAFRAKNKMGALVLDSARYFVHTDGKVEVWDRFSK